MQPLSPRSISRTSVVLLGLASIAVAHGHDEDMGMNMASTEASRPTLSTVASPETYFNYGEHSGLMMAHIVIMTVCWIFVLPIGMFVTIIADNQDH
jgi:hypothetical protein